MPAPQPLLVFAMLECRPWFARSSDFQNTVLTKQNTSIPAACHFITHALLLYSSKRGPASSASPPGSLLAWKPRPRSRLAESESVVLTRSTVLFFPLNVTNGFCHHEKSEF